MRYTALMILALTLLALAAGPVSAQEEGQDTTAQDTAAREAMPQDTAEAPAAFEIIEAVVATGVEDREAMGADSTFTADVGTVYLYTVFEGDFEPTTVEHVWMHDGQEIARVPLTVQGPRWRTWSSKDILPGWTGTWTVKVVDSDGTEHASVDFTVEAGM
jgi:hypothetical protein